MYARTLRLRYVRPRSWHRALFVEGAIAVAIVIVLADLASAWLILALPLAIAVLVKFHDVISGALASTAAQHSVPQHSVPEHSVPRQAMPRQAVSAPRPVEREEPEKPVTVAPPACSASDASAPGRDGLVIRDRPVIRVRPVNPAQDRPAQDRAAQARSGNAAGSTRALDDRSAAESTQPGQVRRPRPTPIRARTGDTKPATPAVPRLTPGPRPRPKP